jgi:hypothetical protein
MPLIPEFGRLKQEDPKLEASLGYIARSMSQTNKNKNYCKQSFFGDI